MLQQLLKNYFRLEKPQIRQLNRQNTSSHEEI